MRWGRDAGSPPRDEPDAPAAEEARLAALAREDPAAFAPLYDRYIDPVYRYCARRLGSGPAAEDATSAVFLKALAALPGFSARGGTFRSWLFAIARNVVIDQHRQAARRPQRPLGEDDVIVDRAPSPEEQVIGADARRSVWAAVAQLPEEQRQIIELRLAGLTGPEIAAVVGRSHAAVRASQYRAVQRLRAELGAWDERDERDEQTMSLTRRTPREEARHE